MPFLGYNQLSVESRWFLPTPPAFDTPEIFGLTKLESMGYHVALFGWS